MTLCRLLWLRDRFKKKIRISFSKSYSSCTQVKEYKKPSDFWNQHSAKASIHDCIGMDKFICYRKNFVHNKFLFIQKAYSHVLLPLLNRRDVTDTSSSYGRAKPQCPVTGKNGLFKKRQLLKRYEKLLYIVAFEWSLRWQRDVRCRSWDWIHYHEKRSHWGSTPAVISL